MTTSAFDKVTFRGHLMDRKTQAFLEAMEARLGYELTVLQGCYNAGGVAASAGTHDGGGVIDLAPFDFRKKVKVARSLGAFAWRRVPAEGPWEEHIHFGIRNHGNLSTGAQSQQRDFDSTPKRNGLATHLIDPNQYPAKAITFVYPVRKPRRPPKVTEAILAAKAAKKGAGPAQVRKIDRALLWLRKIQPR